MSLEISTPQVSPAPLSHDPGPNWQVRYWLFFIGQALSLVGSALTQFVLLWWITDTTGSVAALATAGMVALLPQALLGPLGGVLADRWSRRVILIVSDLISAICMMILIALFLTDTVELWHLYTMMFIRSAMQAMQQPAATASTAMLVPESFLSRAAGLNQTLIGIMTVAAAPLGALAISLMPLGWALSIDVVTALLAIVPLLFFSIPQMKTSVGTKANLWQEFREGFDVVWQHPGLRHLFGLIGVMVIVVMPSFTLVPLLVKEHFGGGATEVAIIESISGLGMIAGGMLIAVIAPKRRIAWVLWGFAIACASIALMALAPAEMFWMAVVWWTVSGLTYIAGNAPFTALVQTIVPNQLQGRAFSLLGTLMGLGAPIGLAVATPLGELIGIRWLFVVLGALGAIVALFGFLSPTVKSLDD